MGLPPTDTHDASDSGPQYGTGGSVKQGGGVALTVPGSSGENLGQPSPGSRAHDPEPILLRVPSQMTGLEKVANGHFFQNFTLLVIVLNGFWIGIDVEWNHPSLKKNGALPLEPTSIVVENLFCVYFTLEIALRLVAFGKRNLDKKLRFWFIFDSVLVTFMVIETWIMLIVDAITGGGGGNFLSKFSTLRLLRLTRLTRLMHSLPELLTLVRGMINAAKAVSIVLGFLVLLMYVFAIVFTSQLGHSESPEKMEDNPYWIRDSDPTAQELFGSMGDSMMTLFTRGLLGDNLAETLEAIKDRGGEYTCTDADENAVSPVRTPGDEKVCMRTGGELWLMWVFVVFFVISAMCLLNMLVGVLCEVIEATAASEEAESEISGLRHNIEDSFRAVDVSGDERITRKEWKSMRTNKDLRVSFGRLGVEENCEQQQMDQIEEHLFARLDTIHMLDDDNSWMPQAPASEEGGDDEGGIAIEEFLEHILQIRPDVHANLLDLQVLRVRAERDEQHFNAKIDMIETRLAKVASEVPVVPHVALAGVSSLNKLAEEPSENAWLRGLSMEVLFAELKHRADLLANASPPALDLE